MSKKDPDGPRNHTAHFRDISKWNKHWQRHETAQDFAEIMILKTPFPRPHCMYDGTISLYNMPLFDRQAIYDRIFEYYVCGYLE